MERLHQRRSQLLILVLLLGHLMDHLVHLLILVSGHLLCHQGLVLVLDQRVQIIHLLLHHLLVLVLHLGLVHHLEEVLHSLLLVRLRS